MDRKGEVFEQVNGRRRSQLIEQQIKNAILSERYKIGEKLPPERELAELFGASRSIVREALRTLEKSGLLSVKTGARGGAYITELGEKPIIDDFTDMMLLGHVSHEEIVQVRLWLEPPAAAVAARKATKKDMERLREANRVLEEGFKSGDAFTEHNPEPNLHKLIAEITGNRLLIVLVDVLMDITIQRLGHIKLDRKTQKAVAQGHKKIVDAVEKKNEKMAFENMKKHVLSVYETHPELEMNCPSGLV